MLELPVNPEQLPEEARKMTWDALLAWIEYAENQGTNIYPEALPILLAEKKRREDYRSSDKNREFRILAEMPESPLLLHRPEHWQRDSTSRMSVVNPTFFSLEMGLDLFEKRNPMITFTVGEQEFTREQISNLLTGAIEGGSNSWYCIVNRTSPTSWDFNSAPNLKQGHYVQDYPLNPGGSLDISDLNEDEDTVVGTLDWNLLQFGLTTMAEKYPGHFEDFVNEGDDALTADVFFQCCIFGDIVYE